MKLILAEKPSVAADFARALGGKRQDGYFESPDSIISFCVGHLLELFEPEDYDVTLRKWTIESLPIIPDEFRYKPSTATKKQLSIIQQLFSSHTIDEIVLATDAGREGELIGRLVLFHCRWKDYSRVRRFWSSEALTPDVIRQGLSACKPINEFDHLYESGLNRQHADWLIGMNFSRFFSITLKNLFTVGRVQTAVLNLIVRRHREIENFKPEDYFQLTGVFSKLGKKFKGIYKKDEQDKFKTKEELQSLLDLVSKSRFGSIISVKTEDKKKSPPPLFNLTALQKEANRRFGFSADKTLSLCQALYETHKCLSYPRTPSKVLGSNNVDLVASKIKTLATCYPECFPSIVPSLINVSNTRVFDDARLEDHHALIPLAPCPDATSDDEKKIYDVVLRSFSAAFHPDFEYQAIKVVTDVNGVKFHSSGRTVLKNGWMTVIKPARDEDEEQEEELPILIPNESISFESARIDEKKTAPPPFYTEATLLAAMEHPGKYLAHDEYSFKKNIGLGTQATRAAIIEILLHREYILRVKKALHATKKGIFLIDSISAFERIAHLIDVDETARWEQLLEDTPKEFFFEMKEFIRIAIAELKKRSFSHFERELPELGKCPKCGAIVTENAKAYYCTAWKQGCTFKVWKQIAGMIVSKTLLKKLLAGKPTEPKTFTKKDGSTFESRLSLDTEHNVTFTR